MIPSRGRRVATRGIRVHRIRARGATHDQANAPVGASVGAPGGDASDPGIRTGPAETGQPRHAIASRATPAQISPIAAILAGPKASPNTKYPMIATAT